MSIVARRKGAAWGRIRTGAATVTTRLRVRLIALFGAVLLALVLPTVVELSTDWLWFGETGYQPVLVTGLVTRAGMGVLVFGAVFVALFANLRVALRLLAEPYLVMSPPVGEGSPVVVGRKPLVRTAAVVSALGALVMALYASSHWMTWLRFRNATWFNQADPILGHDIGFYIFRLPFLDLARWLALVTVVLTFVSAGVVYALAGMAGVDRKGNLALDRRARVHLSVLAAVWLALLAVGAWLEVPQLLLTPSGIIDGASYADVSARLPALRLLIGASALASALALFHAFSSRFWPLPTAVALYVLVAAGGSVYATAVQRFVVTPNEQVKETPLPRSQHRGDAARLRARPRRGAGALRRAPLTRADIGPTPTTIDNVRLWDHEPLLETFGQLQEIRTYYDFVSVDNDRYWIDGEVPAGDAVGARAERGEPADPHLHQRAADLHARLRAHARPGQPGDDRRACRCCSSRTCRPCRPCRSRSRSRRSTSASCRRLRVRRHAAAGVRLPARRGQRLHDLRRAAAASRSAASGGSCCSRPLRLVQDPAARRHHHRQPRALPPRHQRAGAGASPRSSRFDRDPYLVRGRRAAGLDARRLHRRPTAIRIRRRPPTASTTCATASRWSSTRTTARSGSTWPIHADPLARTWRGIFPASSARSTRCRRTCARTSAIRRTSSASRPPCTRPTTWTNPAVFYNREDQWEIPAVADGTASAADAARTTSSCGCRARRQAEFIHMLPFTPARQGQPRGLDGGAERRRALRQAAGLPVPEAEAWSSARGRS